MRASNVEEISNPGTGDPWEVFTQLVIQIIEGRTPGGEKGFHAGPHCSLPQYAGINRHACDPDSAVCIRFESLLRQLRLMWGVGVGVSVEVLVAPECEHGVAYTSALDTTTTAPSPQLRLIEQWNFAVFDRSIPEAMISGWSLVAAVRSFLHFSQLSAWLSASGGSQPPNVLYRLTVTSPVFCSKFEAESEEHTFPIANVGQDTAIKVVVRSLPRSNRAPVVSCPEIHPKSEYCLLSSHPSSSSATSYSLPPDHISATPPQFPPPPPPHATSAVSFSSVTSTAANNSSKVSSPFTSFVPPSSSPQPPVSSSEFSYHCTGSLLKMEGSNKAEEDLRRSMMRARLGDPSKGSRSESPDTQLGESLLDPPNSLSRIPRRFQSPSRSGSPSMETPEHIICRVRQPGPSHARPPDMPSFCQPLVVPARQPLNAFAWTQTRYPSPQQQQQYRSQHHLMHSNIFQASTIPTEPLPVDHQNDSYDTGNTSYPFTPSSNVPQCFYSSDTKNNLLWQHHRSDNIPNSVCSKEISPYSYAVLQNVHPSSRPENKSQNSHLINNQCLNTYDESNENIHEIVAHYNRQNEKYLDKCYKDSYSSGKIEVGHSYKESTYTEEPVASSSSYGKVICNQSTESVAFDQASSSSGGKEPQGTKRKGAYNGESPRTKRESPPHIHYSKEALENEEHKEEKDDERAKRKNSDDEEDDDGTKRKQTNKRGTTNDKLWLKCSDDRLWPSCSQPGKHLCSSVEDLMDLATKEDNPDFMPNSKSLKKKICCKFDGNSSSKVCFDLTPKETQEVLNVLRQNNPLPPLRINQHKTPVGVAKRSYIDGNLKLKNEGGKDEKCLGLIQKLESLPESRKTSSKISPYQKVEEKKARRCHRQEVSKTKTPTLLKEDEKYAYPTSSNKCDTSFKKHINCSCDKLKDRRIINDSTDHLNDSDEEVVDGLSPAEIHNMKNQAKNLLLSNCIEAKKITHKTNYFTANSQPTLGTKDFQKQTSQALRKSPLTSVLSSIKKDTTTAASIQTKSKTEEENAKEKARRALSFTKEENLLKVPKQERDSTNILPDRIQKPGILTIKERDTKFNETGNIFKQLMKKNLSEENDIEKAWTHEIKKVASEGNHTSERTGNKRSILSLEEEESSSLNEEDKEVEDLCKFKGLPIPTSSEKVKFRRSLDSAATLVFHNKTGLPLTSSPAPLRKGTCFDFDSSLNSIEGIRSAFRACEDIDEECDTVTKDCSFGSRPSQSVVSFSAPATVTCSNLLGSFEECVLNGRLEPVSTVHGFSAEIAASGAFCPKHTVKPVTVFFYTLCDNDQISSPYMGHINLGKKGYHVPNKGTVQVTLFNPHGTVVKMFVVVYDLSDMPPNSKTFLRQRTLNMPVGASDSHPDAHQWLRYLIHLRFASSKSNKIYLHTDIRMLIFRKSDADAATLHKTNVPYELRSFTHGPTNPKFSPRK